MNQTTNRFKTAHLRLLSRQHLDASRARTSDTDTGTGAASSDSAGTSCRSRRSENSRTSARPSAACTPLGADLRARGAARRASAAPGGGVRAAGACTGCGVDSGGPAVAVG